MLQPALRDMSQTGIHEIGSLLFSLCVSVLSVVKKHFTTEDTEVHRERSKRG